MKAGKSITSLCVFCGSSIGNRVIYSDVAMEFGEFVAQANVSLIYGGGRIGLMGVLADSVLGAGGNVIGIMPRSLVDLEIAHADLDELYIVDTMHQRKEKMAELADAFVALPGGAGTLDELFEQWTWLQLGIHEKPCGILNIDGYFDPLLHMIDSMVENGFVNPDHRRMLAISDSIEDLFGLLEEWRPDHQVHSSKG